MAQVKNEKAKPLTDLQRSVLIEQVKNFRDVLFCKEGKADAVKRKNAAWAEVAESVNALRSDSTVRSAEQIKKSWENIASKGKKEISRKKTEMKKTGGGPCTGNFNDEETKIISVYGDSNPIFLGEATGLDTMAYSDFGSSQLEQYQNEKLICDKLLAETAYYKEKAEASKAKKAFYEGYLVKIQAELVGNMDVEFAD